MNVEIYNRLVANRQMVEDAYNFQYSTLNFKSITKKQYFQIVYDYLDAMSDREVMMTLKKDYRIRTKIEKALAIANKKISYADDRYTKREWARQMHATGWIEKNYGIKNF